LKQNWVHCAHPYQSGAKNRLAVLELTIVRSKADYVHDKPEIVYGRHIAQLSGSGKARLRSLPEDSP